MKPKFRKQEEFHKTIAVIRDLSLNPCCEHGPTILFDRNGSRFFSCSAYRDRHLCPFHCSEEEWKSQQQDCLSTTPTTSTKGKRKIADKDEITAKSAKLASSSLPPPTQNDRGEAQYHFTEDSVNFFVNLLQKIGLSSIVCVGTPSLHQYLHLKSSTSLGIDSFLLDIDERLIKEFPSTESALYNMCNHHFFRNGEKDNYRKFLERAASLCIITDPPFGAKVELIWNGALKSVRNDFYQFHPETAKCEVLWIFPYFMEGHILSKCPESNLKMSDYKVLYKNHAKFKEKSQGSAGSGGNGKLSPVRIFTSIPLSLIKLPSPSYRYCDICDKWVEQRNLHCDICKTCTTKDGGDAYNHCNKCQKCVKPTWTHCSSPCGTCHLTNSPCRQKMLTNFSQSSPSHQPSSYSANNNYSTVNPVQSGSKFKKSNKQRKK